MLMLAATDGSSEEAHHDRQKAYVYPLETPIQGNLLKIDELVYSVLRSGVEKFGADDTNYRHEAIQPTPERPVQMRGPQLEETQGY